jgi:hypothetical protein
MLSSYRVLFRRAGVRPLALACALAWLSFTGYAFAIILAVHAATGSFAIAGSVVAAFGIGSAVGAPARGRYIDRHGPVSLALFTVAFACWAAALVAGCALRAGPLPLFVFGGVAGLFAPPVIATARSLWARVAGPELAPTAHALNAALADGALLLSPVVVGAITALLSSSAALGALIAGASAAGAIIAWTGQKSATATAVRRGSHRIWGVLHESAGLRTLVACDVLIGIWTGAFEVAATAIAAHSGAAALGAVPLSASAAGSVLISLWSGSGHVRRPAAWRYLAGCLLVAAAFPLMLMVPSLVGIAAVAVVVGVGYALLNVALFQLLDHIVAADRAVEAFTWLTTATAAGTALGAVSAGQLTRTSDLAALLLTSCSAALVAAVALSRRRTLKARSARSSWYGRRSESLRA